MIGHNKFRFFVVFLILALGLACSARAKEDTAASQFDKAFRTLTMADDAREAGRFAEAMKLYRQALELHMGLAKRYPNWQSGVVKFRITYCNNQLEAMMKKGDGGGGTAGGSVVNSIAEERSAAPQASVGSDNAGDLRNIKSNARRLMLAGESEQARLLLLEGLHLDADNKTIRLMIGLAQCQSGMFMDAVYLLAELTREDPANPITHLALGTACIGLGRLDDAKKEISKAIELDPKLAEAHYDMAQLLLMAASPDVAAARKYYNKSVALGGKRDPELDSLLAPPPEKSSSKKTAPAN